MPPSALARPSHHAGSGGSGGSAAAGVVSQKGGFGGTAVGGAPLVGGVGKGGAGLFCFWVLLDELGNARDRRLSGAPPALGIGVVGDDF